jgi:hypothetical protein
MRRRVLSRWCGAAVSPTLHACRPSSDVVQTQPGAPSAPTATDDENTLGSPNSPTNRFDGEEVSTLKALSQDSASQLAAIAEQMARSPPKSPFKPIEVPNKYGAKHRGPPSMTVAKKHSPVTQPANKPLLTMPWIAAGGAVALAFLWFGFGRVSSSDCAKQSARQVVTADAAGAAQ